MKPECVKLNNISYVAKALSELVSALNNKSKSNIFLFTRNVKKIIKYSLFQRSFFVRCNTSFYKKKQWDVFETFAK